MNDAYIAKNIFFALFENVGSVSVLASLVTFSSRLSFLILEFVQNYKNKESECSVTLYNHW